jgi:hypothetical protein
LAWNLDFLANAKIDQLPICGRPLVDTFDVLVQIVPLQILFLLFRSTNLSLEIVAVGLFIRVFLVGCTKYASFPGSALFTYVVYCFSSSSSATIIDPIPLI